MWNTLSSEPMDSLLPSEYGPMLEEIKSRVRAAQTRAAAAVNGELVGLYWHVGTRILAAQGAQGWGKRVVPQIAADLRRAFPDMKGFSPRNLDYMLAFAKAWPDESILQAPLAKLPWYHNIALLEKLDTQETRLWYARAAVEPPSRAAGKGADQFRAGASHAPVGPGPRAAQGPLQLRVPYPRRGRRRAGA